MPIRQCIEDGLDGLRFIRVMFLSHTGSLSVYHAQKNLQNLLLLRHVHIN